MTYADQGMSRNRMISLGAVALIHVLLGYALVTGLASKLVKQIAEPLKTVNIKDTPPPPDEPPPPPPKDIEIPPFVPPPEVTIENQAPPPPVIQSQSVVAPPPQPTYVAPRVEAIAPPTPPAPVGVTSAAVFNARSLEVSNDDYPQASLRDNEEGSVRVMLSINIQGRVDNCTVQQSSNFPKLDEKTCQIALRRFRAKPALQNGTPIASTLSKSVRWQINK